LGAVKTPEMKGTKMTMQKDTQVLIVEDIPLVGKMIEGLLEDMGYTVVGKALDGLQAVEMTQTLEPDVILMDIAMPNMDGIEATRQIHKHCPTPVVVLTAHEAPELIKQASKVGVGAYLVKPPDAYKMERAIAIAIARFNDLMELRRLNTELQDALARVKTLSGLLPICSHCKKIRDDEGYWNQLETYIQEHSEIVFSHGLCPECAKELYPEIFGEGAEHKT
jgi:AmiR/NasT family two-component response regulator